MSAYPKLGYSITASYFHWLVAAPLIGSIGAVMKAQQAPKEEKGKWMWRHKSLGLLTGMVVAPRVAYRLLSRSNYHVAEMVGNSQFENIAGKTVHTLLYGFMIVMPASGIAMGYYGGKGLPFFATTIPGAVVAEGDEDTKKKNGQIAKNVSTSNTMHDVCTRYFNSQAHWRKLLLACDFAHSPSSCTSRLGRMASIWCLCMWRDLCRIMCVDRPSLLESILSVPREVRSLEA
jgi:cytochrome b561